MKKVLFIAIISVLAVAVQAQQEADIPQLGVDGSVRVGVLENGLTYYIRHNEMPKERCEFHIAQAVGSILEEDAQNGLAHFLEHMCFNGTAHFAGKGIIEYFESIGVNFGGNINAYTSLDKTVYRLSDVPTYREGIIDSALLVLHDWSCAVSLLPEEIDAERGVIREEWRTGRTAARRMWSRSNALMYPGTQYAIRDVIGDTAVINNFSYESLRAYYHKWYGPDLQAIIVVGDIDVDAIESKIKRLWSDVPARVNRGERPYYGIGDNVEPIVAIVTDPEAQSSVIRMVYKHEAMARYERVEVSGERLAVSEEGSEVYRFKDAKVKNSIEGYFRRQVVDNLIYLIMSERLQEITMKPDAPIMGGVMAYTDLVPTRDGYFASVTAKEGQEKAAFRLLVEQIEKMRRYGFTQDEVERAKTEMLNDYEKQYNERSSRRNISYAQEYINNYLDHDPIPGIEWEYDFVKKVLPIVNTEALNQVAASYIGEENVIVNIQAPERLAVSGERLAGSEEEFANEIKETIAGMKDMVIAKPEAQAVDDQLVKKKLKAGKIKKSKHLPELDATEWTLKNGVRVVLKKTDFKQDEIRMSAFSWGGESLVKTEDLMSAEFMTSAIRFMGIGDYSATDLQKALSGKTVHCTPGLNETNEAFSGSSSIKDFETLLQLVYLHLTAPRRDEEAFRTLMNIVNSQLQTKESNPKAVFSDSIQMMSTDHSPRTMLLTQENMAKVSLDKIMQLYGERFGNPADFTFFFVGNIDPEDAETKRLICTYLGSLKTQKYRERFADNGVRAPKGRVLNYFSRKMETTTASNRIQYTSYDMPYSLKNAMHMEIIGRILSTRYLESIREREGGSYGVGTYGYFQAYPVPEAGLLMQFDTDPDKQVRLMEIIHEEVQTIIDNGPLATDLQKEKESMLKDLQEDMEKNNWWISTLEIYYKLGVNRATEYKPVVEGITAESVQETLRKLVNSGNMFEVVMMGE